MKVISVVANNKKRCFAIKTKRESYEFPFSALEMPPSSNDTVIHVENDCEIANEGFCYKLRSGKSFSVHIEQVLEYAKDHDYIVDQILYDLTLKAQQLIKSGKTSKRELARGLKTSPTQLYRLLDQSFYGKTIDQMVRLLHVLGYNVKIVPQKAA